MWHEVERIRRTSDVDWFFKVKRFDSESVTTYYRHNVRFSTFQTVRRYAIRHKNDSKALPELVLRHVASHVRSQIRPLCDSVLVSYANTKRPYGGEPNLYTPHVPFLRVRLSSEKSLLGLGFRCILIFFSGCLTRCFPSYRHVSNTLQCSNHKHFLHYQQTLYILMVFFDVFNAFFNFLEHFFNLVLVLWLKIWPHWNMSTT